MNSLTSVDPLRGGEITRLRAEGWRERLEERHVTTIPAKIIRANGATQTVTIADLSAQGLRLDGVEGLSIGEQILVLMPNHQVQEVAIRWALGDQAGARFVD